MNNPRKNAFRYKMHGKSIIAQCRREVKERRRKAGATRRSENSKWLNTEVEEAWTAKMKASKAYSKAKKDRASLEWIREKQSEFNKATAEYKSMADRSRQRVLDEFCEECGPAVTSRFWTLAKEIKSKATGGIAGPQHIIGGNGGNAQIGPGERRGFQSTIPGRKWTHALDVTRKRKEPRLLLT
jgi:hypothetical protein